MSSSTRDYWSKRSKFLISQITHLIKVEKDIVNVFHRRRDLYFVKLVFLFSFGLFFGRIIGDLINIVYSK